MYDSFQFTKNLNVNFYLSFYFSDFAVKMANGRNFVNVVVLSFEEKFVKYYHFGLH